MSLLNKPLEKWTDGQLKMEIASVSGQVTYIVMTEQEKTDHGYPVNRDEMIKYLRSRDQGDYK